MEMPVEISIIVMLFAALLMMMYVLLIIILMRLDRLTRQLNDLVQNIAEDGDDPDPGAAANDNYIPWFVPFTAWKSGSRY